MENLFKKLGLSSGVLKSIDKLGYDTPSEIQNLLIPVILSGSDVFGQAKTGTGKTLAFAASILSNINMKKEGVKAIILSPTRELALQISKEFKELDIDKKYNITAVYGGSDIRKQINILKSKPDIVIGTPGRVKDLIERRKLNLTKIDYFVLDEADEMLNMGFIKDIEEIIFNTSRDKQILMLSATMSRQVKVLVEKYLKTDYKHICIESDSKTADLVNQHFYVTDNKNKLEVLCRIIDSRVINKSIIFVKTRKDCDELALELQNREYDADVIHGDISQGLRIKTLDRFKIGAFKYLIATDVAARGIHVDNVDLVVNYHLPFDKEAYIHRIGRTGRANLKGEAVSIVSKKEREVMKRIEKYVNSKITEKSIPLKDEILEVRYNEMLKCANTLTEEDNLEKEMSYIRDLNKGDLMKLSAALLKYNTNKEIGSELHKEIVLRERTVKKIDDSKTRIFINMGKKDRLKKGDFLKYLSDTGKVNVEAFDNVEILEKFSFLDIEKDLAVNFITKINGNEYNKRVINAEISTKKSGAGRRPRPDGRDKKRSFNRDDKRSNDKDRKRSYNKDSKDKNNFRKRK